MRLRILFFSLALSILLIVGSAQIWIARMLEREIPRAVQEGCASCQIKIASVQVSFWRSEIRLNDIWFFSGDPAVTAGEAKIPQVRLKLSPLMLLQKRVEIVDARVDSPAVTVIEGDAPSPPKEEHPPKNTAWSWAIVNTQVTRAQFTYRRDYRARTAWIRVTEIAAKVGPIDSQNSELVTEGNASGLLEKSGRFELIVQAPLFAEKTQADVDLKIKALSLGEMNPYFVASEGIELEGTLVNGHGNVKVRQEKQDAWVKAKYVALDLHFQKTAHRGALTAFFSNLAEFLKLKPANVKETLANQVRGVSLVRRPEESLVSFIFRGMKDAALRVAVED